MPRSHPQPETALVRKLSQCIDLDHEDLERLEEFQADFCAVSARTDLVCENEPYKTAGVMIDGWGFRYKLLPDGRRQVISFMLPGSFFGLHANVFEIADHSVSTLTRCRIARFDPQLLTRTLAERPMLGAAIVWDNAREEALLMEHLASLGRRDAYERFAHILVELAKLVHVRGEPVADEGYTLPVPQIVFADALGLSLVHVSRTLRKLKQEGLIDGDSKSGVVLRDLKGLISVCGYEETYLHQSPLPDRTRQRIASSKSLA